MLVRGVDGCRGGWLAADLHDDDQLTRTWTADIGELLRRPADVVAIDIPIGLPDAGNRACDQAAREALGRRGVTVFPAPVRPVLTCRTYAEARAVLAAAAGPSMSAQAFGIVVAVRQVDGHISPDDETRVIEAHPELAFAVMAGGTPLPGKRTGEGAAMRRQLIGAWLADSTAIIGTAPSRARPDDVLDALACAWVARRWRAGNANVFGDGTRDERGLLMRIVA